MLTGRRGAWLLAAVLLAAVPAAAADPAAREAAFAAAVQAYDRGDYAAAHEVWLPLARHDDAAAQRNLGHLYRRGLGVAQDFERAAYWYRRAAEIGLAGAQVNLALMHLRGQGVPLDHAEAAYWLDLAARQGHVLAQYNIGLLYLRGLGVPESQPHALGWLYRAGKAGHKGALEKLSQLVAQLPGPPRPAARAAPQTAGTAPAPRPAAPMPLPPRGVAAAAPPPLPDATDGRFEDEDAPTPQAVPGAPGAAVLEAGRAAYLAGDYGAARAIWQEPAAAGDSEAQYLMGNLCAEARFTGYDLAESYRWHYLAALNGHEGAEAALEQLETEISAADRVRGLQLVKAQDDGRRRPR